MKFHCMFEQSGTFKNEFKKLGYEAIDYDILNNYGETDVVIDLFGEIKKAYAGGGVRFLTKLVKKMRFLHSSRVLGLKQKYRLDSEGKCINKRIGQIKKS